MCIAVPMEVVEINDNNMGVAELNGVKRDVGFMLLEDINLGDWVLIHAGFAISRLNREEAEETLSLLKQAELLE